MKTVLSNVTTMKLRRYKALLLLSTITWNMLDFEALKCLLSLVSDDVSRRTTNFYLLLKSSEFRTLVVLTNDKGGADRFALAYST